MDTEASNKRQSFIREAVDFLKSLAILLVIYFLIKTYIAQPFIVKGRSMETNFHDGDYVVVDELSYQFRDPYRFEVIVFSTNFIPGNSRGDYYIKRVIGLPGDRVVIDKDGVRIFNQVYSNGWKLEEPYLSDKSNLITNEIIDLTLGANEYFVMGDNRANSSDSRVWGALQEKYIVGKPLVRLLPFSDITLYTQDTFSQMPK